MKTLPVLAFKVPVLIIVKGDPAGRIFVSSVIVWMNDLAVVTLIFGNLMQSVHFTTKTGGTNYPSEQGGERGGTTLDSKPPARNDDNILDANEDQTVAPTFCTNKEPHPRTVSSLSLTSRRLSVKSVTFNENVSISEIPLGDHSGKQNLPSAKDRFAATKGECAPLKPNRTSTDKGAHALSLDSTPNIPKRPTSSGTSELEDLPNSTARSPLAMTTVRRSSGIDFSPTPPRRAAAGESELDHQGAADDPCGSSRPSHMQRRHSFDSSNASVTVPPTCNEKDGKRTSPGARNPRRLSVDSIPSMPKRGTCEFDVSLDKLSYELSHQIQHEENEDVPRGWH